MALTDVKKRPLFQKTRAAPAVLEEPAAAVLDERVAVGHVGPLGHVGHRPIHAVQPHRLQGHPAGPDPSAGPPGRSALLRRPPLLPARPSEMAARRSTVWAPGPPGPPGGAGATGAHHTSLHVLRGATVTGRAHHTWRHVLLRGGAWAARAARGGGTVVVGVESSGPRALARWSG